MNRFTRDAPDIPAFFYVRSCIQPDTGYPAKCAETSHCRKNKNKKLPVGTEKTFFSCK